MSFSRLFRKVVTGFLVLGSLSAIGAASFPHMFQISVDSVPMQMDMTVYKDNTAYYSEWGGGAEASFRYVSPIGITVGLRGGYLRTPYNGSDMVHYPAFFTLGYRIPAGSLGIGIEGVAGYDFMEYGNNRLNSVAAGGRIYFEAPFADTGFSATLGAGVLWSQQSPVTSTEAIIYRISVPVTVGITYSIPVGAKDDAIVTDASALKTPSAPIFPFINNMNISVPEPGLSVRFNDGSELEMSDEIALIVMANAETEEIEMTETAEVVTTDTNTLPAYIDEFYSLPDGEAVPEDLLKTMGENPERFPYSWSFRRAGNAPDAPVSEAWVTAEDPETGASLVRTITPGELEALASYVL